MKVLFYTRTRNPIARAGIIRKLMAKGYVLAQKSNNSRFTVSDYFQHWWAYMWPYVTIEKVNGELVVNLSTTEPQGVYFSPVKVDIPLAKDCEYPNNSVVFPEAAKYSVDYVKADGSQHNYTISNPIEANKESITAYAFGRGVRTFKKVNIRRFARVA